MAKTWDQLSELGALEGGRGDGGIREMSPCKNAIAEKVWEGEIVLTKWFSYGLSFFIFLS